MSELPPSWTLVKIVDVLAANQNGKPFQQGWSPQCEKRPAGRDEWGVLKTTAIQEDDFRKYENKRLPDNLEPKLHLVVSSGDILMTCAGPRSRCGVVCLVKKDHPKLMMSGKMYRFRCDPEKANSEYLMYFLRSRAAQDKIDRMKTGINDSGLNLTHSRFSELDVPLAPKNEQERICRKVEELFSELDRGIESLKIAHRQLEVFRQSVLKHAFEGKLTAQWREENKDKLEKPEQLLARIKQESATHHEQQLQEWTAAVREWEVKGKLGRQPTRPSKVKQPVEIVPEELAPLPNIPTSWCFVRLCEVAQVGSGMSVSAARKLEDPVEVPYLRVANVQRGFLDLSEIKYMSIERSQLAILQLKEWDVLFNEGGDRDKLGRGWIWQSEIAPCITQNHVFKASPYLTSESNSKLLSHWGNTFGQGYFEKTGKQTTNLASINKTVVSEFPVPLIPSEEQEEICKQIDRIMTILDAQEQEISIALGRADLLRQAILRRAFSGELVPQDPNDEPASVLLDRIKAQKEQASKRGGTTKKTRKQRTAA